MLGAALAIGALWDLRFRRIPNWLTLPAAATAIVYHTAMNGLEGFLFSLEGMALGIAILLPFYLKGGMGAGDVKLLGVVGAFLGPHAAFTAFLFTALVGGIYALALLIFHGYLKKTILRYRIILATFVLTRHFIYFPPPEKERKHQLLYGLAISLGTLLSLGFGSRIL